MSPTLPAVPLGDGALTVRVGTAIDATVARRVHALAEHLVAARVPHVQEIVIGYAALTVWYDSLHVGYAEMVAALRHELLNAATDHATATAAATPREHVIPVRYDGPDLADVARRTNLTISDVIARHSAPCYDVYLLGFVPGFAYLGELDPALSLPRRSEPRSRVPAGSVAIAGAQTGVYPLATPGGWHLIGRTSVMLFDPAADPPARLAPGDRVRFIPDA